VRYSRHIAGWVREATAPWNIRGIPRLLYASRNLLLGREPGLFELYNNTRLYLDPNDYVQCMMFYNRYSREILEVFRYFAKPGETVIDVGAHIGYFTLFLAELVGSRGHVYCFEPDPRAMNFLKTSITASRMDWIEVSPLALAQGRGTIDFYLAKGLGSSSAIKSFQQVNASRAMVSTISLDELVDEGRVTGTIRLIKIDIEGFELEAIRGMVKVLKIHRPIMVIEVNNEMLEARGETPAGLLELVASLDYKIAALMKSRRGKYKESVLTRFIKKAEQQDGYYDVLCLPIELEAVTKRQVFSDLGARLSG
jgi:FkbM family methyltransferase